MTFRPTLVVAAAAAFATFPVPARAQDKPSEGEAAAPVLTPEQQAIANQANAFIDAYNKSDAKAITAMFAEDAEWVDDQGNVTSGREAIGQVFKDLFESERGRTIDVDVESVRPLTSDVMLEKGTTTVTAADGTNAVSSYTAVHVKKGDAWLISQFTETGSPLSGSAARRLSALDWLVGSWEDAEEGVEVKSTIQTALNDNFITWTYTVVGPAGNESRGTEIIGWDPNAGKIRSWGFEGDGSLTEKSWTQDGPRWLIQSRTILPDGSQGTEEQTLTQVDKDTFTWSSASRQVGGEALPNISAIKVVRAK